MSYYVKQARQDVGLVEMRQLITMAMLSVMLETLTSPAQIINSTATRSFIS